MLMEFNKRKLIGICGVAHSGKDTVGSMIHYIKECGTYSDYNKWNLSKTRFYSRNLHFADIVKDVTSCIFKIDIKYFNDSRFKDELLYIYDKNDFISILDATKYSYNVIGIDALKKYNLNFYINRYNGHVAFSLRTLLQYVGTEIGRNQIDNNIWINNTIRNAMTELSMYNYCVITDVRFQNEIDTIQENDGIVFRLLRPSEINSNNSNHVSEQILDLKGCIDIENNGTLLGLYYKIYQIVFTLLK